MATEPRPVFLARESYRRRRLADAACLAPVIGIVLLLLPAMWAGESRTASAMIYVFTVWALLILFMVFVSRRLSRDPAGEDEPDDLRGQDR